MTVSAPLWLQSCSTMWPHSFITCRRRKCSLRCVKYCCFLLLVRHFRSTCPFSISIVLFYVLHIAEWAIDFKYWDNRYKEAWLLWTHLPGVSTRGGGGATVWCCSCNHTCCCCYWFSASHSLLAYLNIISRSYTVTKKAVYFPDLLIELSGVVFNFCRIYWLLARTSGFAVLFVVANCARENGSRRCSYDATIARRINVCAGGLAKLVFVTHVFVRVWGLETLA